jgi:hypothetical protein
MRFDSLFSIRFLLQATGLFGEFDQLLEQAVGVGHLCGCPSLCQSGWNVQLVSVQGTLGNRDTSRNVP